MLSRGTIIGKIIDDLALLKTQIEFRNKAGHYDLTKISEDFFREISNIVYDFNLKNLNKTRINEPGLDLGDPENKIAFQVTSRKDGTKVEETLKKITEEQLALYKKFKILVINKKQTSYSIKKSLIKKCSFKSDKDIIDLSDLIKDISILDVQKLFELQKLFQQEFRTVRVELEPVDEEGNFESSYYNFLEDIPAMPPKNAKKLLNENDSHEEFDELIDAYYKLAKIPKATREILSIIVEKGELDGRYQILTDMLERFLHIEEKELLAEIRILQHANIVSIDEDENYAGRACFITIDSEVLTWLFEWCIEEGISIRTLLNKMDFSVIDN